ncbi:class I SAM-dependent DNA methyltransferase [Mucilaginibacter lutimaris]|uniref:Class I SAM-dependent DNA methyltransferase n=1 Tax=Mucilaginibacter lutimaris TaxID=931629 RepID=A0ABW2ZDF0_9SPHI
MNQAESNNVYKVYDKIANWFATNRDTVLLEQNYLDKLIACLPANGTVLDVGCGTGKPILQYLLSKDLVVTGIDASSRILEIARFNFPQNEFILGDMRQLNLKKKFDAIIAWHSFFHLPAQDQPAMFNIFKKHLNPNEILLFTSGTENGEAWGMVSGENLFHASLDKIEYENLLKQNGFAVLQYTANDPDCGYAKVWMAKLLP